MNILQPSYLNCIESIMNVPQLLQSSTPMTVSGNGLLFSDFPEGWIWKEMQIKQTT